MKKIGIVTIYDVPNYGSVLQAFATQKIFENNGFETKFIKYDRYNSWLVSHSGQYKPNPIRTQLQKLGLKSLHRKIIHLNHFKKKYFKETRIYKDLNDLKNEDWSNYDLFAVGSDQVWNPRFCYGDSYYMLSFIPECKKRISVASSFAVQQLPNFLIDKYRKYLNKFDALSVRENNGISIINKQLGINKEVMLLLDPTLLLSDREWCEAIPSSRVVKSKYILYYMWDYAFNPLPYINEVIAYFHEKTGYEIVILEDAGKKINIKGINVIKFSDASIPEFIDLFAHAEMVVTSSFHGTAFAVNFGKPLVSIVPACGDDRQSSLLRNLDLTQCIVNINTPLKEIDPFFDVQSEQKKLKSLRNKSILWLLNIINK